MEDKIKQFQVRFIGSLDWQRLRDLLVLKMQECTSEKEFAAIIEKLIASMFRSSEEIDETRKKLRLDLLTESEKEHIDAFTDVNEKEVSS